MEFRKPQDYVDALKRLEGFPLMGMEVRDGRLFFTSLSSHVALPLRKGRDFGYIVTRYGLNKLDVLVDYVKYNDQFRQVRLFDENGDVIAHVELKNVTRKEWLLGKLYGENLHSSMNVNQYKKYALLATGVVFTAEADGLTGVFVHWPSLDSPVNSVLDQGDIVHIMTKKGTDEELMQRAFELLDPFVRLGWTVDKVVSVFDATGVFFDNGAAVAFDKSEYRIAGNCEERVAATLTSMRRVRKQDGSDAWKLIDEDGHAVFTVEIAQPTDPLPVYVAALKESLIGSSVQSVSVSDSGLCLHLDDDYDAVTNGALRVRVDSGRVPFTVGDVFVNRGGADLTLCICAQTESKPVVAFNIDQDALESKEIKFNVI